jgi:hypothetical protein
MIGYAGVDRVQGRAQTIGGLCEIPFCQAHALLLAWFGAIW